MRKTLLFVLIACCSNYVRAQVPSYVALPGLLAWYPFNNSPLNAYMPPMNNGVAYGGVAYGTDRFGAPLSCYVGNGASGIDVPTNNFITGNGARSLASWFKLPLPMPSGYREIF